MFRGRMRPSPAMVVAFVALFVAIGGSSYAVTRLPANSVGSAQLRRSAVHPTDLASGAVTGAKVKNGSLSAADIAVSSLAGVASAVSATNATNATHAGAAAAVDRVTYASRAGAVPPAPVPVAPDTTSTIVAGASAACPPGTFVVGGGVGVQDNTNTSVVDSFPEPGGHAWTARVDNSDSAAAHGFTVVAVCLAATTAG
jgi:hypothetical protein